jgi:hypothetical protein
MLAVMKSTHRLYKASQQSIFVRGRSKIRSLQGIQFTCSTLRLFSAFGRLIRSTQQFHFDRQEQKNLNIPLSNLAKGAAAHSSWRWARSRGIHRFFCPWVV